MATAFVLGALVAAPARGQNADSVAREPRPRSLPPIEIVGSVLPVASPTVGSGVPARTATLDGSVLRRGRPRLLAEPLAAQPGFSLYDDLGSPFKPTLSTRGFTASPVVGLPQGVSVFIDGVPVNEPDAGQVNFDLLPLAHVERVEVLSGTASLLGPHSLGGAINLVTRRGAGGADGLSGELAVGAGSYGRRLVEGAAGGGRGDWRWYVGAGAEREQGWRQRTPARLGNLFANVGRYGARAGAGVQLLLARSRTETAGSLPESVFGVRPDSNLSSGDFEDLGQFHLAATGYAPLGAGRGALTAYARAHDAERFNVNQAADPDVRGFSRNRSLGLSADWRMERPLAGGTLGVRVGGGARGSRTGIRLFAERIAPELTTDVESPITSLDLYTLLDWRVGRVLLSSGARWDRVRIPYRNLLDRSKDTSSTYRRLNPRGGVSVELLRGLTVHASVGRSFRAPAVIELACADPEEPCPLPFALGDDPPLAPVVATTREGGVRLARGVLLVDLSAYRTDLRDDIWLFPYEEEGAPERSTIDGYFANIAGTRREGIEVGARLLHPRGHALHANWGLTHATFQAEAEIFSVREAAGAENEVRPGSRIPLVPRHTAAAGALVRLASWLDAGADARYVGARWLRGDEGNATAPLPGYWLAAVHVGVTAGAWSADLALRNALDRRVATFGTFNVNQGNGGALERFLTPSEPRSVQLVLRRHFGARE